MRVNVFVEAHGSPKPHCVLVVVDRFALFQKLKDTAREYMSEVYAVDSVGDEIMRVSAEGRLVEVI